MISKSIIFSNSWWMPMMRTVLFDPQVSAIWRLFRKVEKRCIIWEIFSSSMEGSNAWWTRIKIMISKQMLFLNWRWWIMLRMMNNQDEVCYNLRISAISCLFRKSKEKVQYLRIIILSYNKNFQCLMLTQYDAYAGRVERRWNI